MSKKSMPTARPAERAFLVGAEILDKTTILPMEESLAELVLLAETAGLEVVGSITQRLRRPDPKTFIGSGKVNEVKLLFEELMGDVIIFDDELSPRHQRELEKAMGEGIRILDRTALILDIFALHANTREGSLQVELAQYEYRLPRLTRAWTHLARQAGGGGGRAGSVGGVGLRGPGETQLEVDKREITRRITTLREEIEKVRAHRSRHRVQRRRLQIPTIALVGYTNAGKSTLLNQLSNSDVYVADKLFATLDPTTRRVELPDKREVLFTDTVGFIQKLPTQVVAAFRATLEEITEADLILHVVDISHPSAIAHAQAVYQTLEEIQITQPPVVTALNKIDCLPDGTNLLELSQDFERSIPISALTGAGIEDLLSLVAEEIFKGMASLRVKLPYTEGRLISLFHDQAVVMDTEHGENAVVLTGKMPHRFVSEFAAFQINALSDE